MTQTHHIQYKPTEWTVELTGWQHKVVTHLQRCKPSANNYAAATNFMHAVCHEWNRIRCHLDDIKQRDLNQNAKNNPNTGKKGQQANPG